MADSLHIASPLKAAAAAWYQKEVVTFADLLFAVRREIWGSKYFSCLYKKDDPEKLPQEQLLFSLLDQLAAVA